MSPFRAALWAEALKARRSKVPWLAALGLSMAPLVGGLFMYILQDPERARSMGLLATKAQLTAGTADWPSYFGLLAQAVAVGGAFVFALVTAWVFGREFADHTAKELLALPTSRGTIVAAKFTVIAIWTVGLVGLLLALGLAVGFFVGLPGWSSTVLIRGAGDVVASAALTMLLMPAVALVASVGRGYLPPLGWAILTVVLAQIVTVLGWGAWFPWAVPALHSAIAGTPSDHLGPQSYILVILVCVAGFVGTVLWWRDADHVR